MLTSVAMGGNSGFSPDGVSEGEYQQVLDQGGVEKYVHSHALLTLRCRASSNQRLVSAMGFYL
jgi:hypothetical protein